MVDKRSICCFCLILLFISGCKQVVQNEDRPFVSSLVIEPAQMDLGEVMEGDVVEAIFLLRNTGKMFAQVVEVQTSCGCTVAKPETSELAPGAFTRLHVKIDTTAKQGSVKKRVRVLDGSGVAAEVWLNMVVKPKPQHAHKVKDQSKGIFHAPCASCHAAPAHGKVTGEAIYKAVCAMCHGTDAQGAYAPNLRAYDPKASAYILQQGLGRQMPAFSTQYGGPLNGKQIEKLSRWLGKLRN